jgi:hypothetical protein
MHLAWELVDYIEHAVFPPIVGLAKRAPVMTSWKPHLGYSTSLASLIGDPPAKEE